MIDNSLQYNEILVAQRHLQDLQYQHWLQYELYTSQWWCLVAVLIIPWLIWWRIVDRKKTAIILAYGLYILIVVTAMDTLGALLQLWIYPIKLLPVVPDTIAINWGLLTVVHMLIYQCFPRWKSFIIAETTFAALLAFIGEPIAEWFKLYFVLHWYHTWSFPIYVMKTVIGKWLIESLVYRK